MRIDGVRLEDVDSFTVVMVGLGVLVGLAAFIHGAQKAMTGDVYAALGGGVLGLILVALFAFAVYENAKPEYAAECDGCGSSIQVNSGTSSRDGVLVARQTKPPRRLHLGPISLIVSRRTEEMVYCSSSCADRDAPPECAEYVTVDAPDDLVDPVGKWQPQDEEVAD